MVGQARSRYLRAAAALAAALTLGACGGGDDGKINVRFFGPQTKEGACRPGETVPFSISVAPAEGVTYEWTAINADIANPTSDNSSPAVDAICKEAGKPATITVKVIRGGKAQLTESRALQVSALAAVVPSPQPASSPSGSPGPAPAPSGASTTMPSPPTPQPGALEVTITEPTTGATPPRFTTVKATIQGAIPVNSRPILVITDPLEDLWGWTNARNDPAGSATWTFERIQLGIPADCNQPFKLTVVVTADRVPNGRLDRLPAGPSSSVDVTRGC